jgi:hypothetical protein
MKRGIKMSIKYNKFKNLSKSDKEEYIYRFKDIQNFFPLSGILYLITIAALVLIILMFTFYLNITVLPEKSKVDFAMFLQTYVAVMRVQCFLVIGCIIGWIIQGAYNIREEWKWMRERTIQKSQGEP